MRDYRYFSLPIAAAALALAATGASAGGSLPGECCQTNWSGFYVGAAVGYGFGNTALSNDGDEEVETAGTIDVGLKGAQAALAIGYDVQLSPRTVLGVFADYAFGEIDGDLATIKFTIDEQWAIGGRIGLLATPSTLLHASAGYTRADFDVSGEVLVNQSLDGFFVGLGVEQAVARNVSLKLDYRFSDYEDFESDELGVDNVDNETHSIRVGLNWRFGRHDDRAPLK